MAISFQGFRSLIENSPDAISLIDTQGEILYGSASSTRILGYEPDEMVGRNCLDLIHPEDRDQANGTWQELLLTPPGPFQWDARVRHKDGSYCWVESTLSNLLFEPEVQAIVMQQRNIDARRAAEAEPIQHAEELARSNRRLEEFARIAAHDLREPLLSISLYTELLAQKKQMDENAKQMAQIIITSANRMAALVEGLLSFAASGVQAPARWIDLKHTVSQAVQNLAASIKTSGAVLTVGRMPVVRSDEIQLVSLFQNLISNAVKYRGDNRLEIGISAEQRPADWLVKVQDNGIGIAQENHDQVFMPFVRIGNRNALGSGLGLAVCKNIVEGLGGSIWLESKLGVGSIFCFTILDQMQPAPNFHDTV
jgi:PAS domain S-box-containing protein